MHRNGEAASLRCDACRKIRARRARNDGWSNSCSPSYRRFWVYIDSKGIAGLEDNRSNRNVEFPLNLDEDVVLPKGDRGDSSSPDDCCRDVRS